MAEAAPPPGGPGHSNCPPDCPYPHSPLTPVHGLKALYFGHSFIEHWRNDWLDQDPQGRAYVDILELRHFTVPGYDISFETVNVWGKGGLAVDGQHKLLNYISIAQAYDADINVLDIGTNDMSSNYKRGEASSEEHFVQRRVHQLGNIVNTHINSVSNRTLGTAICEVINRRRFGASGVTFEQFDNRRYLWNKELKATFPASCRHTLVGNCSFLGAVRQY